MIGDTGITFLPKNLGIFPFLALTFLLKIVVDGIYSILDLIVLKSLIFLFMLLHLLWD